MAEESQRKTDILESGDIFFLFRPRVEEDSPSDLGDVQRFHVVLRPEGRQHLRLLTIGRKRMPEVGRHERNWGFVAAVTDSPEALEKELREQKYETKTRGKRRRPAARPAGEGVYAVSLEDGEMHLSYALELPDEPGDVQRELNIAPEASFVLSVKNPDKEQPRRTGPDEDDKADYPDELQASFRGRRFSGEHIRLLDYEGAEFVMVGARTDPERGYGLDLETQDEDDKHADVFRHLRMAKSRHPVRPLFEGKWD